MVVKFHMILKKKNLISILGLVGFLVSSYLSYIDFKNNSPLCLPDSNCDFVLKSQYSKFFGFPVALWGIFYFASVLILNFFERLKFLLKLISFLGFLFALYLIYIQSFVLQSFCFYCLISDTSAILIFILSFLKFNHLNFKI